MNKLCILVVLLAFAAACSTTTSTSKMLATDAQWDKALDNLFIKPQAPWSLVNRDPKQASCSYQTALRYKGMQILPFSCKSDLDNGNLHCTWHIGNGAERKIERWFLDTLQYCKWRRDPGGK